MPLTNNHVRYESARLKTFKNWPGDCPVRRDDLARQGFQYIGPHDRVQCVFCHGILKGWAPGDTVQGEHRRHFPRCPFLRGRHVGNVTLEEEESGQLRPHYPDHQSCDARITTLSDWPGSSSFDRSVFAEAGFFFLPGPEAQDSLHCFSCGGILRNWEYDDDPWIEHAKWFPNCHFLKSAKGERFINEIYSQRKQMSTTGARSPRPEAKGMLMTSSQPCSGSVGEDIPPPCRTASPHRPKASAPVISEAGGEGSHDPEDRVLCKVCMDNEVEVTFLPCGHLVCCSDCAPRVRECPICRSPIKGSVRSYLS